MNFPDSVQDMLVQVLSGIFGSHKKGDFLKSIIVPIHIEVETIILVCPMSALTPNFLAFQDC